MYEDCGNKPNMFSLKELGLQMCSIDEEDRIRDDVLKPRVEIED